MVKDGSIAYVHSVSKIPIEVDRSMEEIGSQVHIINFLRKESDRKLDQKNGQERAIGYLSNFWKQELRSLCTNLYAGRSIHDHIRKESDRKLDRTNEQEREICYLSNLWKHELRSLFTKLYTGQLIHDHIKKESNRKLDRTNGQFIRSFTNKTRTMATSTTTTQMTTTTAASLDTDATFKTGFKGLGLNGPTSQVLTDQGILRLKDLEAFGADELDGWMRALHRQFPTPETGSTKDDLLFIPLTVVNKLKALLAWNQFQYACDHKDCAIVTFTYEVTEEWIQQIDDIAADKDQSDDSLPLDPMKTLLDWKSWEEGIQGRAQNMRNPKTGVRLD